MYFKVLSQSLVLLLGFFNPFVAIIAQNPKLEQISAADGLSQGMIYDLLQDNKGYIWFSTRDGLNRYDGYYCRVYQNNPFDPFSLSDNEAQVIREDKLGRIWVGTVNNGLSVFDPTTGKFHHIRNLPSQNVNAIFEGPDGEMWIGTNNGLCKIRVPDSLAPHKADLIDVCQVETITLEQVKDQQKTTVTSIRDLLVAPDGKIWVATKNQFGYYNPQNKSYTAKFDFDGIHNGKNGSAYFRLGPDQSIWVCLPGRLMRYKGDLVSIYQLPMSSIFPRTDCVFDPHGNLFVSTRKQIFKLPANCVDRADHPGFELFYEFPSIGIAGSTKMMFDQGGLLWIGTNGYGALKHNPGNPFFKHYAKGRSPRRIFTDNQNHVWAFLEGGLFGK
ncbi:MAG: hypothetical protein JNJ57_15800 [Saprospiraceae bacterium]|nr:hypothetical protein [Saprospiraceae bacterium]